MIHDTIHLSSPTAEGIGHALDQDFCRSESPDRMAWIVMLLKLVEDRPEFFPGGKWATIQAIESQLAKAAIEDVKTIGQTFP